MVNFSVNTNAGQLEKKLADVFAKQIPFAAAQALSKTAVQIKEAEQKEMRQVFDRPKPYTINAFTVIPARTESLVAEVRLKEARIHTQNHYLENQSEGGPRQQTRLERQMAYNIATPFPFWGIIPAAKGRMEAGKLDQYGNWDSGQRNRVLSDLRAQSDRHMNVRKGKKVKHFVPKHGLAPGIYRRDTPGGIPERIVKFIDGPPNYAPRFHFHAVAIRTFNAVYPIEFQKAIQRALATAR